MLAAADAFVDETANVAPPPPQPRHRDPRLDLDPYGESQYAPRPRRRRYYSVFAVLALVAIGTATVLVLRGGNSTGAAAPLITADTSPTRVFPDETTTADPSNVVFDRVDPDGAAPAETNLLDGAEPVTDLGATTDTEDGIGAILAPTDGADTNAADLPRMVRTVTVLPDGTIVDNNTAPAGETPAAGDTGTPDATADNGATPPAETPPTTPAETPATETAPAAVAEATPPATETPATTPATETATTDTTADDRLPATTPPSRCRRRAPRSRLASMSRSRRRGRKRRRNRRLQDFLNRAPSILTGEPTAIDRADLPQGTYYRVLFGPYSSADADALRQRLAAVGIDAFIQRY